MSSLADLLQQYADKSNLNELEGVQATSIPGVSFYRSSQGCTRQPFVYQSGIIILGQGHKTIYIGHQPVHYGPEDYLVVGVPMPLECEACPEEGKPLLGLSININATLLYQLVNELEASSFDYSHCQQDACALTSIKMNDSMLETTQRLIKALHSDLDSHISGASLVNEIVYRVLIGSKGQILFNLAHRDGRYAKVAKSLNKMHQEYAQKLTVENLAKEANMSVSAFHLAFRKLTLESPLQYLKKVRLNKAKELIQLEGFRVNDAARSVGYSSVSQFSREFKRHFNITPKATSCISEH